MDCNAATSNRGKPLLLVLRNAGAVTRHSRHLDCGGLLWGKKKKRTSEEKESFPNANSVFAY